MTAQQRGISASPGALKQNQVAYQVKPDRRGAEWQAAGFGFQIALNAPPGIR